MSDENPIVGHKTFADGHHEPIRKLEADAIWAAIGDAEARREAEMPDTITALIRASDAQQRLRNLGWREGCYCPKDGSQFAVVMFGSTGIHSAHYMGKWPDGHVYCGDFLYGTDALMWKSLDTLTDDERAALSHSDEETRQFMERQYRMFGSEDPSPPDER